MLSVRTLRWISVAVPTAFVVVFELVTRSLYGDAIPAWGHTLVILGAVAGGAFAFSSFVFATLARLEREVRERNRRLALLNAVASQASESLDLEEVAGVVASNVKSALGATAVAVTMRAEDEGELKVVAQAGLPPGVKRSDGTLGAYDCECRKALALGETVVISDSRLSASCSALLPKAAGACVSAPIRSKGNNIGALLVIRSPNGGFTRDEIDLISALGSQIGPVLQNAQLFSNTGAIAILQERQRVAREVHDGLAQTLGYLNVQMGIVEHLLARGEVEKAQSELDTMAKVTREAYEDLRQSIADLRMPVAPAGSLRRTLREYVERFSLQTGIPCHFEGHRGSAASLPAVAEVQLIRIVQEALANVRKHAPNAEVWVAVTSNARAVSVEVRDSGPGFDPAAVPPGGRFGLKTMKERAESVGGKLTIDSRPGAGTRVHVVIPTEEARAA